MVEAIEQNLGKAIYIQELNMPIFNNRVSNANILVRGATSVGNNRIPAVEFEKIKLEYSILARFKIE